MDSAEVKAWIRDTFFTSPHSLLDRQFNAMSELPQQQKRKAPPVEDEPLQAEEDDDDDAEEGTPQLTASSPMSQTKRRHVASHLDTLASPSTPRTGTRKSSIRNPSDLLLAMRPVVFDEAIPKEDLPESVQQLIVDLSEIKESIGIMPYPIKEFARQVLPPHGFKEHWFDRSFAHDPEEMYLDWKCATAFIHITREHRANGAPEAAWNEDIHMPLLRRALNRLPYVKPYNVTCARPCAAFARSDLGGVQLGVKLVDYTINLEPRTSEADAQIKSLLSRQPANFQTITQTMHNPVRFKPAAISIETKSELGDDYTARTQLAQWAAMHFARLRALQPDKTFPVHPLIGMNPGGISIYFAIDQPEQHRIVIVLTEALGAMRTLADFYRAFACIRLLGKWADTTYRTELMAILN